MIIRYYNFLLNMLKFWTKTTILNYKIIISEDYKNEYYAL
jgi:hypothetical protein